MYHDISRGHDQHALAASRARHVPHVDVRRRDGSGAGEATQPEVDTRRHRAADGAALRGVHQPLRVAALRARLHLHPRRRVLCHEPGARPHGIYPAGRRLPAAGQRSDGQPARGARHGHHAGVQVLGHRHRRLPPAVLRARAVPARDVTVLPVDEPPAGDDRDDGAGGGRAGRVRGAGEVLREVRARPPRHLLRPHLHGVDAAATHADPHVHRALHERLLGRPRAPRHLRRHRLRRVVGARALPARHQRRTCEPRRRVRHLPASDGDSETDAVSTLLPRPLSAALSQAEGRVSALQQADGVRLTSGNCG